MPTTGSPSSSRLTCAAVYNSPEGHKHVRQILASCQPCAVEPHDYQLEGICASLDKQDVLATMATGAGKTGFFSFLMLVICTISMNPSLALANTSFPKNPAMIVICPTKALQADMVKLLRLPESLQFVLIDILQSRNMIALGLSTVVINADTCAQAHQDNIDLWVEARDKYTMILMSPEELISRDFAQLLAVKDFFARICMLGVDEVHLLYVWGKSFRTAYQQIGLMRSRLPLQKGQFTPLVALSATLRDGPTLDSVRKILGLSAGKYHFLRRSNMRHDIQIIFREMSSGIGGVRFPELDWILDSSENTVIFCKTIALGFRVACYLWRCAIHKSLPRLAKQIRLFNSLNWPSYNVETLHFLNNNPHASVVLATDVLSVGWDSRFTRDAVILGEPDDIDEFVQKIGRVGRDHTAVPLPRAFLYFTRTALATANKLKITSGLLTTGATAAPSQKTVSKQVSDDTAMDLSMAYLLLADCKSIEIDRQYNNLALDVPCMCSRCQMDPPPTRPENCRCSGKKCMPEENINLGVSLQDNPEVIPSLKKRARRGETIGKELRAHAITKLEQLRWQFFNEGDNVEHGFFAPQIYLPDMTIKTIINKLYSINEVNDLGPIVSSNKLLQGHHDRIFQCCQILRIDFVDLRAAKQATLIQARKFKQALELESADESDEPTDQITIEKESENGMELTVQAKSILWKINFQTASVSVVHPTEN